MAFGKLWRIYTVKGGNKREPEPVASPQSLTVLKLSGSMYPTQITGMVDASWPALPMAAGTVNHLLLPNCFEELLAKLLLHFAVAADL